MNLDTLGLLSEIVAAVAVVVSLVYLARQVRQHTESVEAATELEASRLLGELHSRVAHSKDMADIWDVGMHRPGEISAHQKRRFIWLLAEFFYVFEATYQQWRRGYVSDATWKRHEAAAVGILHNPIAGEWWKSGVSPYTREFLEHLDRVASERYEGAWTYTPLSEL